MASKEVRNDQQVAKTKTPTPSQIARENVNKVFEQLKRTLEREGVPVTKWEDLGSLAQEAIKSIREQFKAVAEKGPISAETVKAAYLDLRAAQRADGVIASGPPKGDALSGLIDLSSFKIKQVDGGYTVAGLDAGHPLKALLAALKIGDVFPESIAGIIDTAAHSRNLRDLSDPKTWTEIATQMAKAALASRGSLKEKVVAAAGAAVTAATTTEEKPKVVDKEFGPVPQAKLDKESIDKTGKTSGEGSVANVTNIRAALLAGVKGQHKTVEETAGKILKAVFSEYGINPDSIPKADRQALHKTLTKLLKDDSSVDGKISPEKLMQSAVRELEATDVSKLGEAERDVFKKYLEDVKFLASGFEQILKMHPEGQDKPHVQAVLTQLAAGAVGELIAAKMGRAVAKESRLIESINLAMKELTGQKTEDAPKTEKSEQTDKTDKTKKSAEEAEGAKKVDGTRPWTLPDEISDTARAMAAQFLIQPPEGFPLRLGAGHPKFDEVVDVVAALLDQSSKGTKAGQLVIDGPKFAVDVWQWLVDNAKLDPVALERVKGDLADASQVIDEGNKLIAEREAKMEELQKKKESSAVKGELEDLETQITALEREVHQLKYGQGGLADIVGRVGMYQAEGLARVTEFIADPQMFEKDYGAEVAGAGGNAPPPKGPSGPKGPDDPEDDGRFRFFDRETPTGETGLTGLFGGGRPEDYDGKNLTIQQQRAIKCGEILNDVSLCIEDKIFLFMMWFSAFADQEREQKMKELVQMDEREARLKKDKDETYRLLQSQVQTKKKKDVSRQQCEGDVTRIKNQMRTEPNNGALGGELEKANVKLQKAEAEVNEADKAVQDLDKQHRALKRKEDRAPKSREVMFMELERLNKLRDMVMNMARTMMQNADRNIEKLFR